MKGAADAVKMYEAQGPVRLLVKSATWCAEHTVAIHPCSRMDGAVVTRGRPDCAVVLDWHRCLSEEVCRRSLLAHCLASSAQQGLHDARMGASSNA